MTVAAELAKSWGDQPGEALEQLEALLAGVAGAEEGVGLESEPGVDRGVVCRAGDQRLTEHGEAEQRGAALIQPGAQDRRRGLAEAAQEQGLELGLHASRGVAGERGGEAWAVAVAGRPRQQGAGAPGVEVEGALMAQPGAPHRQQGQASAGARQGGGGRFAQEPRGQAAAEHVGVDGLERGGEQAGDPDLGVDAEDATVVGKVAGDVEREVVSPGDEIHGAGGRVQRRLGELLAQGELAVGAHDREAADAGQIDRARVVADAVDGDQRAVVAAREHARELVGEGREVEAGGLHVSGPFVRP
jgi:hypothetical protein